MFQKQRKVGGGETPVEDAKVNEKTDAKSAVERARAMIGKLDKDISSADQKQKAEIARQQKAEKARAKRGCWC